MRKRIGPLSVEIAARQRTAIISVNDTVGVEHGNNFKQVTRAKERGDRRGTEKEVQNALHHP